ncbi:hypothetical protein [Litchfieldia salsa]|uniref:Prepilin-type N-terminal cleavage/methylation domain-containing protein n=1 Tax=Litchfieldia salsa TaxID=930152 RepID=A0A1H0W7G6_9BACI|nr:hypothetical protein [Litchfieldia salsa]SDP86421.1 hypothetical protein SAMN05216565_109135 [Litchfieldia salsa]
MGPTTERQDIRSDVSGFILIEVISILSVLMIISLIAVLSVRGIVAKAESDVCEVNRLEVERMYEAQLDLNEIEHSDTVFEQYI